MRAPLYLYSIAILLLSCSPAKPLTQNDIAGTWHIDRDFAANQNHSDVRQDDFYQFRLTLSADGNFLARNIPNDLFLHYTHTPVAAEHRGTWVIKPATDSEGCYYLNLSFTTMKVFHSSLIDWKHGKRVIGMSDDGHAVFYLTKEE